MSFLKDTKGLRDKIISQSRQSGSYNPFKYLFNNCIMKIYNIKRKNKIINKSRKRKGKNNGT